MIHGFKTPYPATCSCAKYIHRVKTFELDKIVEICHTKKYRFCVTAEYQNALHCLQYKVDVTSFHNIAL